MPTQSKINIINVTTDVYHEKTAAQHFREEELKGTYLPLLHVRTVKIKGEPRTAFNVCRLPLASDEAFVETQRNVLKKRPMTYPFIGEANMDNLCIVVQGEVVRKA